MTASGTAKRLRVGFAGLGAIGTPMARRLIQAGLPVTLWARREASLAPFRGTAFTQAAGPAQLRHGSDVVGVCVLDEAGVHEVVLGDGGVLSGMRPTVSSSSTPPCQCSSWPDSTALALDAAARMGLDAAAATAARGNPASQRPESLTSGPAAPIEGGSYARICAPALR